MNSGRDLRDISFYGRDICEGHLCPSYDKILDNEARIVVDVIDDWYLYGIVITDIDFIKTFFFLVQNRLGESIDPGRVSPNPGARAAMMRYFNLKIRWPFRDTLRPRFGKYFFLGEEYDIDRIDYESLGASPSVYDPVFLSLSSVFNTRKELTEAEDMVNSIMDDFIYEYTRVDNPHH
ncbi:MAG: hypothetical protein U9P80_06920, partial [Thermodesulfobacteriota bacterium]|nr:hypothetical protein [Thermodesulfobacteriota bacterium]